jgi:hypothetical protein
MIPLYTEEEFKTAKSFDELSCQCLICGKTFKQKKYIVKMALSPKYERTGDFCSLTCQQKSNIKKDTFKIFNCCNCNKEIIKQSSASKRHKNTFCSHSCSTKYLNSHKTTGTRRSKLEMYVEEQLTLLYPNLDIKYNDKSVINSELDIHIPSLNLAFELNGIFHYEPIFGVNKLDQIQTNDISKSKACIDAKIDLCIIDTSGHKYVKPKTSEKYLNIIIKIINTRLA